MPLSRARDELADLANRVHYSKERITLLRRGKPVAVLISTDDLDWLERMEDLADLQAAQEALADPDNQGPEIPWEQLKAELAERRQRR